MATYWCAKHYELIEVLDQRGGDQWIVLPQASTTGPHG